MFVEDLAAFTSIADFGVTATVAGVEREVIFDAPGVDELTAMTTEPSALVQASFGIDVGAAFVLDAGDLPSYLAQHAGTYSVRSVRAEPPDGAFVRLFLVKES